MRYLIAILLGLLAAGCGNKAVDNLMSQASMLIEEHPDSALLALRQIDPSAISPAADARRRLLLAQTYSRTGAEADKDSLTAPALDYYERHGSGAERAYAWYFDAKVHHNAGDLGRAIKGYTQAMLYAERNRDKAGTTKLLMALYHTLGLLYLEQGYDTEAEEAFSKAVAAAQETGSGELEGYSRYMLSSAQYANGRYAEAIETLSPLVGARDTMAFRFFAQQITLQNLIYHTEWQEQIDRLTDDEAALVQAGEPQDWLKETHAICVGIYEDSPEGTKISYDYVDKYTPVIEQQLVRGGYRLARLLNEIYR